jgi:hypothetical protein
MLGACRTYLLTSGERSELDLRHHRQLYHSIVVFKYELKHSDSLIGPT